MLRHNSLGGPVSLLVLGLAIVLMVGSVGIAEAQCAVGTPLGGQCVVDQEHVVSGVQNFTLPLHILNGGIIRAADQSGFTLNIDTAIPGDDFIMESGALVTGELSFGACTAGQQGAPVTIQINGGNGIIKKGAIVRSKSNCPAGWVQILTSGAGTILVDGLVESVSTASGSGPRPGGGPISIIAGCELTISDDGVVSSRGQDPGADLVHLEGCQVLIQGLVESTGTGHGFATSPPNSCSDVAPAAGFVRRNPATRPGKPGVHDLVTGNSNGCVEIWSGTTVEINSVGTNRGEVHADVAFSGGATARGWIEIVARGDIKILDGAGNDTANPNDPAPGLPPASAFTPPIAAIHANAGFTVQNAMAGLVDVISLAGVITTDGFAVEASAVTNRSNGGFINFLAGGAIDLDNSTLHAQGDSAGTNDSFRGTGGQMSFRSFAGSLLWREVEGNVMPTGTGIVTAAQRGIIEFLNCNTGTVDTTGTDFPFLGAAATTPETIALGLACGGAPTPPAYVVLPLANCLDVCEPPPPTGIKRGVKCQDDEGDGCTGDPLLNGWTIVAFKETAPGSGIFLEDQSKVTGAGVPPGSYEFTLEAGVNYKVCEVLQAGWQQTFPVAGPANVTSCVGLVSAAGPLGAQGYLVQLAENEVEEGNDFGNKPVVGECPEDPKSVPTLIVGQGGYASVCAAYADAQNDDIIGVFANTTENCVLGGAKTLKITQCTKAQATAADSGLPVYDITSTGILTIIGLDTVGGTVGWKVQSSGHTISGVRASGASQYGIQIIGNSNVVSFNTVENNAVGIRIEGDGNDVRGGTVQSNSGDGVFIAAGASNNTFRTATVKSNAGNGIAVAGSGNTVRDNKAARDNNTGNALAGIFVGGTGNTLQNNETNDNGGDGIHVGPLAVGTILKGNKSNRGAANGTKENGLCEYRLDVLASAPTQNQADNVNIPQTKCAFFPGAGCCE